MVIHFPNPQPDEEDEDEMTVGEYLKLHPEADLQYIARYGSEFEKAKLNRLFDIATEGTPYADGRKFTDILAEPDPWEFSLVKDDRKKKHPHSDGGF